MTATGQQERGGRAWAGRIAGARLAIAASAIVLGAFVATGFLPALPAAIGFAIIAASAWIGRSARRERASDTRVTGNADVRPTPAVIEALISALPDPAVALDREGLVIAFNERARMLAPALRSGEPASLALRMPEVVEAIRQAGATGEARRAKFSERVPVDRWFEAHVTALHLDATGPRGRPDLVLMTIRDLTPLRRVEEMRADFVANASHELRTPLASLSGFIETLQGSARDDAAARDRFLAIMQQQAFRMARLIDDLLSLSRIELNLHVRPVAPVDLIAIVRQVTDAMQMLARERGVEVVVSAPEQPVVVPGDRDELVRVFENLVENALKYGASGKRVEIDISRADAERTAAEAMVSVRDFGPGIAPEHLPRLTERFYRVDVAQSRAEGGTGLGLAIVKHILNRHGGRLAIDSQLGAGATFSVRLPVAA
jgi:two-component system phosphate regulon sensor histidine kinase PhoR